MTVQFEVIGFAGWQQMGNSRLAAFNVAAKGGMPGTPQVFLTREQLVQFIADKKPEHTKADLAAFQEALSCCPF